VRLLASEIAAATGGRLVGPDVVIDGASFDSRSLTTGQLFVAIVADRDGHEFVGAAVEAGATAILADRELGDARATTVVVDDTAEALMRLATWARRRLDHPVVGITGSVGKTSTKDLVAGALGAGRRVTANERSFNNEQGLPVTILGAPDDTEALVVEMGMRGFGQITRLCDVAAPTIGVVTVVAAAHTELVGDIEGVARAKRELVEALPADGVAVLNADDHRVAAMAGATEASVVTFGSSGDVRWGAVVLDEYARPSFRIESPWGAAEVRLAVSGGHMVANAAAAIAVAGVIEGSIDGAATALADVALSSMRMQVDRASSGAIVINDAYNANPTSMRAALDAVAAMPAGRRVAVLGAMGELSDPDADHRRVMADAVERGVEVVAVGTDRYGVDPVADASDPAAVVEAIGPLGEGDVVLVKASRAAGLERVAEALLDG